MKPGAPVELSAQVQAWTYFETAARLALPDLASTVLARLLNTALYSHSVDTSPASHRCRKVRAGFIAGAARRRTVFLCLLNLQQVTITRTQHHLHGLKFKEASRGCAR